MSYSIGLDIGSVAVKVGLVSGDGEVLYLDAEKITASPRAACTRTRSSK